MNNVVVGVREGEIFFEDFFWVFGVGGLFFYFCRVRMVREGVWGVFLFFRGLRFLEKVIKS